MHKAYYNPGIRILVCHHVHMDRWHFNDLAAPFWRVYCNFNDSAKITANKKEYRLLPRKVFLISPDTSYAADNDSPIDHFYLHFQAGEPFDICSGIIMSWDNDDELLRLIDDLAELLAGEDVQQMELSMKCLLLAQSLLLRVPPEKLRRNWNDARVLKVIEFMERNYQKRLTNQMFADISGMNANAFARLFKEETGLAPQRFLMHKRVNESCLLLRYSALTIDEVAERTGFCDRHYFSRIFTKMRCMSPVTFRRLQH
ncbi:MAG: AraC family transcriptional regulator [Victivallales bacterium]